MRVRPAADDPFERAALALGLAPLPAAYAMFGMAAGRAVGVGQRVGVYGRLLDGPLGAEELAGELGLQPAGTRLLCESLAGLGILEAAGGRFALARGARRWLDPGSPTYIGTWLEHSLTYWEWWGGLEGVVRDGGSFQIHDPDASEHEYWRLYITGQYELARLSAPALARAIRLPRGARRVLDLGGGHGWFAAELCRRHEGLTATVIDLPGSARVGREIIAAAGMQERVEHIDGDMLEADLRGPYDAVLLLDVVHHISEAQLRTLLARVRSATARGGTVAVLDMFRSRRRGARASAAALGLFFHLTSGADLPDADRLAAQLAQAGFGGVRRRRVHRIPDQLLLQARAL